MIAIIIILSALLIVTTYMCINMLRKVERYEDELKDVENYAEILVNYFDSMNTNVDNAYNRMKEIDKLGSFEADDETGYIFKEIKEVIEKLRDVTLIFRITTDKNGTTK